MLSILPTAHFVKYSITHYITYSKNLTLKKRESIISRMLLKEIRLAIWDNAIVQFWVSLSKAITRRQTLEEFFFEYGPIAPIDESFVGYGEGKDKIK